MRTIEYHRDITRLVMAGLFIRSLLGWFICNKNVVLSRQGSVHYWTQPSISYVTSCNVLFGWLGQSVHVIGEGG